MPKVNLANVAVEATAQGVARLIGRRASDEEVAAEATRVIHEVAWAIRGVLTGMEIRGARMEASDDPDFPDEFGTIILTLRIIVPTSPAVDRSLEIEDGDP